MRPKHFTLAILVPSLVVCIPVPNTTPPGARPGTPVSVLSDPAARVSDASTVRSLSTATVQQQSPQYVQASGSGSGGSGGSGGVSDMSISTFSDPVPSTVGGRARPSTQQQPGSKSQSSWPQQAESSRAAGSSGGQRTQSLADGPWERIPVQNPSVGAPSIVSYQTGPSRQAQVESGSSGSSYTTTTSSSSDDYSSYAPGPSTGARHSALAANTQALQGSPAVGGASPLVGGDGSWRARPSVQRQGSFAGSLDSGTTYLSSGSPSSSAVDNVGAVSSSSGGSSSSSGSSGSSGSSEATAQHVPQRQPSAETQLMTAGRPPQLAGGTRHAGNIPSASQSIRTQGSGSGGVRISGSHGSTPSAPLSPLIGSGGSTPEESVIGANIQNPGRYSSRVPDATTDEVRAAQYYQPLADDRSDSDVTVRPAEVPNPGPLSAGTFRIPSSPVVPPSREDTFSLVNRVAFQDAVVGVPDIGAGPSSQRPQATIFGRPSGQQATQQVGESSRTGEARGKEKEKEKKREKHDRGEKEERRKKDDDARESKRKGDRRGDDRQATGQSSKSQPESNHRDRGERSGGAGASRKQLKGATQAPDQGGPSRRKTVEFEYDEGQPEASSSRQKSGKQSGPSDKKRLGTRRPPGDPESGQGRRQAERLPVPESVDEAGCCCAVGAACGIHFKHRSG